MTTQSATMQPNRSREGRFQGKRIPGRDQVRRDHRLLTLIWLLPIFAAIFTSFRTQDDITARGFWSTA